MFASYLLIVFYTLLCNTLLLSFSIPIELTDTDNYLPPGEPKILTLMVSRYNCEKQHNLSQFNLSNVKQGTEAPSNTQHDNAKARIYVRAKAKLVKAFKCAAYAKNERKICFQGSFSNKRVDRTVWNHNTLPLPITLDPNTIHMQQKWNLSSSVKSIFRKRERNVF